MVGEEELFGQVSVLGNVVVGKQVVNRERAALFKHLRSLFRENVAADLLCSLLKPAADGKPGKHEHNENYEDPLDYFSEYHKPLRSLYAVLVHIIHEIIPRIGKQYSCREKTAAVSGYYYITNPGFVQ